MKKKIIYLSLFCLAVMSRNTQAQNVGIGTQAPTYPFTVKDSLLANNGKGFAQVSPDGQIALGTFVSNSSAYIQTHTNTDLKFSTNDQTYQMVLQKGTGNVGIGGIVPTAKLDVDGTLRIRGGDPGAGKVLTSNANGTASWAVPATPTIMDSIRKSAFLVLVTDGTLTSLPSGPTMTTIPYAVDWYSQTFDNGDNVSSAGVYTAPSAGGYHFEWSLYIASTNGVIAAQNGNIFIEIWRNGAFFNHWITKAKAGEELPNFFSGSIDIKLSAGDEVEMKIGHFTGSTWNTTSFSRSTFSGHRVY